MPGFLSVITGSYGPIKGKFDVLSNEPLLHDISSYDHVVEASIQIDSGILEIIACGFSDADYSVIVSPGSYRIRVCSAGLRTVVEDEGDDFYTIQLWPAEVREKIILKQFEENLSC
jgi:hypothetical protein